MSPEMNTYKTLVEAKRALGDVSHERIGELQNKLDYETIPIWKPVAFQIRVGLIALGYRQNRPKE